jgi:signal transduction histidine kinase
VGFWVARPQRVELHLAYEPSAVRLTVEDFTTTNGTRPSPTGGSRGYGLTGMRERAELLGGTLATETTPSGIRVQLIRMGSGCIACPGERTLTDVPGA